MPGIDEIRESILQQLGRNPSTQVPSNASIVSHCKIAVGNCKFSELPNPLLCFRVTQSSKRSVAFDWTEFSPKANKDAGCIRGDRRPCCHAQKVINIPGVSLVAGKAFSSARSRLTILGMAELGAADSANKVVAGLGSATGAEGIFEGLVAAYVCA
jgi:hypothetical protein